MIKESFSKEETNANGSLSFKSMLVLAIATSIDALAAGITFWCFRDKYLCCYFTYQCNNFYYFKHRS